jgi:hypothetical protein
MPIGWPGARLSSTLGEGSDARAAGPSGSQGPARVSRGAPCVGCALVLAAASIGLALNANRLDPTLYTLVRDLPWAGIGVWGACMAWSVARSNSPWRCRMVDAAVWPRASRFVAWGVALALAVAAILSPRAIAYSERGLSLRVVGGAGSTGAGGPPRLVPRIAFDETSGPPWTEFPLAAAIDGWVYAPIGGRYHFELTAWGDALLGLDGAPHLGVGDHGATLRTPWATDPATGARRAAIDLEMGFHRLTLVHRRHPGGVRLRLRWAPPYLSRYRAIPRDFLLAGETSAQERRGRSLALSGRRAGTLVMVLVLAAPLGSLLVWTRDRLAGRAPPAAGQVTRTGSARSSDVDPAS